MNTITMAVSCPCKRSTLPMPAHRIPADSSSPRVRSTWVLYTVTTKMSFPQGDVPRWIRRTKKASGACSLDPKSLSIPRSKPSSSRNVGRTCTQRQLAHVRDGEGRGVRSVEPGILGRMRDGHEQCRTPVNFQRRNSDTPAGSVASPLDGHPSAETSTGWDRLPASLGGTGGNRPAIADARRHVSRPEYEGRDGAAALHARHVAEDSAPSPCCTAPVRPGCRCWKHSTVCDSGDVRLRPLQHIPA